MSHVWLIRSGILVLFPTTPNRTGTKSENQDFHPPTPAELSGPSSLCSLHPEEKCWPHGGQPTPQQSQWKHLWSRDLKTKQNKTPKSKNQKQTSRIDRAWFSVCNWERGKGSEGGAPTALTRETHRVTNPVKSWPMTTCVGLRLQPKKMKKVPYFFFRSGMITASTANFCILAKSAWRINPVPTSLLPPKSHQRWQQMDLCKRTKQYAAKTRTDKAFSWALDNEWKIAGDGVLRDALRGSNK